MAELNIVEKVIALEAVELLKNLTPDQLARIASIAREIRMPRDRVILEPQKALDALYVVLEGTVRITRNDAELTVAGRNEVLGAWALFDPEPMPITATVVEDARLLRISRDDFYDLLADNTEITQAIFTTLVKRFRKLVEQ
jgi:CRP-like cAMP-binding protein